MGTTDVQDRLDAIVKAYDIRGLYPEQLNEDIARRLGAGVGQFTREDDPDATRIIVGRDMRPGGRELVDAFVSGLTSYGYDVLDIGMISTDMLYFAAGSLDAPGAVFTASHNPAGYNGVKLCRRGAAPIGQDSGLTAIKAFAVDGVMGDSSGTVTEQDLLSEFATHVHSFIDVGGLRPLKVVADAGNGMGGLVAPAVFDGLPIDLEMMYGELDGTFPNHPADPIQAENLVDLQARVLETGADIGLAFDGDADRVFIVDENSNPVSGSLTTAMVAASILDREPGSLILHNLICSKTVTEVVAERGGTSQRTRVGHSFIKEQMKATGAIFAGEHSGHYYFRDNWRADSGLITTMVVLEMMSRSSEPLSEMRKPFDRYSASGEINTRVSDQQKVMDHVASNYPDAEIDYMDGMTVDLGEWWFNLRPSNTEPLLRLNLEAPTSEDVDARVAEIRGMMDAV